MKFLCCRRKISRPFRQAVLESLRGASVRLHGTDQRLLEPADERDLARGRLAGEEQPVRVGDPGLRIFGGCAVIVLIGLALSMLRAIVASQRSL